MPKHIAELLDVLFGTRIELGKFFERSDARGSLLQEVNEHGYRRPSPRLVSQRRSYGLPKIVRKTKFLPLCRSRWSFPIYDPFHYHCRGHTLWERHLSGEHLADGTRCFRLRDDLPAQTFLTSNVTIPKAKTSDSYVERPNTPSVPMSKSSGAIHRSDPLNLDAEVSVQLGLAMVVNPKSPRRTQPDLSTRTLS